MGINIGKMFWNRAYLSPDMEAFVGADYRFSFKQVNDRSNQFASFLKQNQLKAGDRLAVLCKNNEHATTAMFGAAKIGVITLMLNWRLQPPELIYILNDCGAGLLLYDAEFEEAVKLCRNQIPANLFLRVGGVGPDSEFQTSLAEQSVSEPDYMGGGDDPAVLMYTSGTTGKPKGVMLTHNNLFWASIGLNHTIDWAYGYRFLSVAPLFHIGGLAPIFGNIHAVSFLPHEIADAIAVFSKVQGTGCIAVNAHFTLDIACRHIIGFSQRTIRVYPNLGNQENGDALCSGRISFNPGKNRMDDILGQIMITSGDKTLCTGNGIGAVRISFSGGFQGAYIGTGSRFRQAHRTAPGAVEHFIEIDGLQFFRAELFHKLGCTVG